MKKTAIPAIAIAIFLAIATANTQETQEGADGPCYDIKVFTEPSKVKFNWQSVETSISREAKKKELAKIKGGIRSYIDTQTAGGGMDPDNFIAGMHIVDITEPGKKMKAGFYGWINAESLSVE